MKFVGQPRKAAHGRKGTAFSRSGRNKYLSADKLYIKSDDGDRKDKRQMSEEDEAAAGGD